MTKYSLADGARIGPYTVLHALGSGGMAAVYAARHVFDHTEVALKVLHRNLLDQSELVTRFIREGEATARLRHPNVVRVFELDQEDEIPYIVMELLRGETLGRVLKSGRRLARSESIDLLLPIASALGTAHAAQIVHRDLKPENVFLSITRQGECVPKLLDFGISKASFVGVELQLTSTNALMGTPRYMSPEQARGAKEIDGRADQFSFGLILYEMLAGQPAIVGDSLFQILNELINGELAPIHVHLPDLEPDLEAVLERILARDPSARYPSMLEVGKALLPFASATMRESWNPAFSGAISLDQLSLEQPPVPVDVESELHSSGESVESQVPSFGDGTEQDEIADSGVLLSAHRQTDEFDFDADESDDETLVHASSKTIIAPPNLAAVESFADATTIGPADLDPRLRHPRPLDPGLHRSGQLDPRQLEAGQLDPGQLEAGQLDPGQLEAGQLEAGHAEPTEVAPLAIASGREFVVGGRSRPSRALWLGVTGAGVLFGLLVGGLAIRWRAQERAESRAASSTLSVVVSAEPDHAEIHLDGQRIGIGSAILTIPDHDDTHRLRFSAEGYVSRDIVFRRKVPTQEVVLEPIPRPESPSSDSD